MQSNMVPPLTYSPFPLNDLGNLLALLELLCNGGDPLDAPTPWIWPTWQKLVLSDSVLWEETANLNDTGMLVNERNLARAFVQAYHASGDTRDKRVKFADELSEGDIYKGRQWLMSWWRRQWVGDFEHLAHTIKDVLEKGGILSNKATLVSPSRTAYIVHPRE